MTAPTGSTGFDLAAIRAETPNVERSAFLVSAGSSLPTQRTLEMVIQHLHRESTVGGYRAADDIVEQLAAGRAALAQLVGGAAHEVALATSDSAAWVKAWMGWVLGGNVAPGSVVAVDQLSYHTHYTALVQLQSVANYSIEVLPSLPDGTTDIAAVQLHDRISVISATMIATHSGNINPIGELGALARTAGIPMFVDGCQALGQLAVDVRSLGASLFTGTGRKWLRAPRGTGMLWVAEELIDRFQPPFIDGVSSTWSSATGITLHPGIGRFEEFEMSYASMLGLAAAAEQANAIGLPVIEHRVTQLADRLRGGLAAIPSVTVHDTSSYRCGIVTFSVGDLLPATVINQAASANVTINSSTANWAAIDMEAKQLSHICRASTHYFNTESEIDRLIDVVADLDATAVVR
jgi:cysteine desulfurase / selenocysteine lyase